MYPCGKAIANRTHVVGEGAMYMEERNMLEEVVRKVEECTVEKFVTLGSSEKTIAILGGRWWPQ